MKTSRVIGRVLTRTKGRAAFWLLALSCGHTTERKTAAEGTMVQRPPDRVRCIECV